MTLSTSGTDRGAKTALVYLLTALFCALFGGVYECFSHEVYSYFMIYAFAFPLVGGTLVFLVLHLLPKIPYPGTMARNLYHAGIATLTVGSIVCGILEIFGTTNSRVFAYWIVGAGLCLAGILCYLLKKK